MTETNRETWLTTTCYSANVQNTETKKYITLFINSPIVMIISYELNIIYTKYVNYFTELIDD